MKKATSELVSIVTPVYNAERFIRDTIKTVQNQSYDNWELLLINDDSSDSSSEIIQELQKSDKRIKLFHLDKNSGAAVARNKGIDEAKGRYIAFLDADDLWHPEKLTKQIAFMQEKDSAFSFTGYEFTNEDGKPNGKKVYVPETITYTQALKNTTIWTTTVIFDLKKLIKDDIYMPNIKRGQDTATWWKVLKKIDHAHGQSTILAFYRRTNDSLSANKFKALKRTWHLYRNVEKLSLPKSSYNFFSYCLNAAKRRV